MKSRNGALAIALVALAVLFYAVSVVRMREVEDRRHQTDPKAHASGAPASSPRP
ncbi:MAG: hypothetical protein K2Z25_04065 [Beijerinckiaceae bacterium]|jgi:hypothetical protein|uniref:hypothetical protein n=1 Tax=Bosea sp. (in: a-proteobacteria) TaxID=1871050 RepID=UPI0012E33BBC|nr:hypothetical protein [Bosea sp. (in: a-proteobacteria)]MBX9907867.1 hypothetical protein [Beijerinckiaceae bacterium]MDP3410198.1 hypothetical protein [Bosea sp. (in: a-proteobacteria)]WRH56162.1 MAG: hypothetical protein RSE11_14000 [Bosea sp. (in: a-proteobacteria)]